MKLYTIVGYPDDGYYGNIASCTYLFTQEQVEEIVGKDFEECIFDIKPMKKFKQDKNGAWRSVPISKNVIDKLCELAPYGRDITGFSFIEMNMYKEDTR